MTAKELALEILDMDEDVQDYEVAVICTLQLGPQVRLTARMGVFKLNPNVDVGAKLVFLKAKETL